MTDDNDYYGLFNEYDSAKRNDKQYVNKSIPLKKKKVKLRYGRIMTIAAVFCLIISLIIVSVMQCTGRKTSADETTVTFEAAVKEAVIPPPDPTANYPKPGADMAALGNIYSEYAILTDVTTKKVIAGKAINDKIYPASMTKVMTALVAAENIADLNAKCTITADMIDSYYKQDATMAGFTYGEQVPITDLFYGALLESGADASSALAYYVSGSETAFVELMNKKAADMGLKSTHFTNPVGMHDQNHYTTVYEMAIIMQKAIENPFINKVLSLEEIYKATPTKLHPEGLEFKSTFMSRIFRDMAEGVYICGGKTGYTSISGHCVVSFAKASNGDTMVLVTAKSCGSKYYPIYDCKNIYASYSPK